MRIIHFDGQKLTTVQESNEATRRDLTQSHEAVTKYIAERTIKILFLVRFEFSS